MSERADIVTEVGPVGEKLRTWPVGDRPYPAGITHDGILLFVPGRDGDSVTVIDTLNNKVVKTVPTPDAPQGGAVTHDDVYYIVAAGGADALAFINTASFEIVATVTDGVGPRPFSVTMVPESPHALVNNAGGKTISVLDVRKREIMGAIEVGSIPIVVSVHPDGRHILVSCEGDHHVAVLRVETPSAPRGGALTEVVVMGMIHSGHRTSERYGLDTVEALVRAIGPDDLCVELPPNRFEAAMSGYLATGELTEQRARVFPEYTDVVFPLQKEMGFTIIPTAGWTKEMNDYRRARLDEISEDPARADQWGKHERAMDTMEEALDSAGESDDPRFIHTDRYDAIIDAGYSGPYNEFFNDDLADGGWDNINRKHYSNIARHLDSVRGQGRRVLITYGAAHKGWFLRELRKRDDVRLLDVREFLDQIEGGEDGGE